MRTPRHLLFLLVAMSMAGCTGERMLLHQGERILFFGDSITQLGVKPNGYVTLIKEQLTGSYPNLDIEIISAGISGNKVTDLQERLAKDVVERKPTIVVIYIGINDVWHWALPNHKGTAKEDFERVLREIIARIQYSGAKVLLCTPTVIGEVPDSTYRQNSMLAEYAGIDRRIAKELGIRLCDLNKAFDAYLLEHNSDKKEKGILTTDGVHLNDEGNRLVANEILKFLGER
jgi:lysophospholipase L1-like esterase